MLILAVTLGGTGCASVGDGPHKITISSEPTGATVLSNGVEVGATPITVVADEVFPPRFVGFSYRAAGTLGIKKDGCKPYSKRVDDAVLRKDIHVVLECDPSYQPPAPLTPPVRHDAPTVRESDVPAHPESAEARLRRIDALRDKGLISDEEHRTLRQRVLDSL